MNLATKVVLSCGIAFVEMFMIGIGLLMCRYDFSIMFRPLTEKLDGLYIRRGLKLRYLGENTLKNRMKYSRRVGFWFIAVSTTVLLVFTIVLWRD